MSCSPQTIVVPANSDQVDKVGLVLTPSILARERIVSRLRVTMGVVPQPCRPPA
jgi:hypothetical protein